MSCKPYVKALHLNRPGELSKRQMQKLKRHLTACESCSELKKRIERAERAVAAYKKLEPPVPEPGRLADSAIQLVCAQKLSTQRTERSFSVFLDRLTLPKVRFGLLVSAAVIVAAFFVQESVILSRLSHLEKKMTLNSNAFQIEFTDLESLLDRMVESPNVLQNAGVLKSIRAMSENERVSVKRGDLERFIRSYRNSRRLNAVLLDLVQEQFTEIQAVGPEEWIDLEKMIYQLKEKNYPVNPSIHL